MTNPYEAPAGAADSTSTRRPRWLRRLVILNALLLAIPLTIVLWIYLTLWIESVSVPITADGEVVTYHHELVMVSGPLTPIVVFFLVPNLVLLLVFAVSKVRRKNRAANTGS